MELLADWSNNLDYGYVVRLFQEYCKNTLGSPNGKKMFKYLGEVVENYNISGNGKAVLQEFDAEVRKSFILCIVTGLMYCIHETVLQASKICYMDASTLFEPLNTLITLLYTSCTTGTLFLELFIHYIRWAWNHFKKGNKLVVIIILICNCKFLINKIYQLNL